MKRVSCDRCGAEESGRWHELVLITEPVRTKMAWDLCETCAVFVLGAVTDGREGAI